VRYAFHSQISFLRAVCSSEMDFYGFGILFCTYKITACVPQTRQVQIHPRHCVSPIPSCSGSCGTVSEPRPMRTAAACAGRPSWLRGQPAVDFTARTGSEPLPVTSSMRSSRSRCFHASAYCSGVCLEAAREGSDFCEHSACADGGSSPQQRDRR
jgi:hypothetical protein